MEIKTLEELFIKQFYEKDNQICELKDEINELKAKYNKLLVDSKNLLKSFGDFKRIHNVSPSDPLANRTTLIYAFEKIEEVSSQSKMFDNYIKNKEDLLKDEIKNLLNKEELK